jgi:hypothetical protein
MTKLVLVLAVVVVVILVVVIVAVRNMRSGDPDEFADQRDGRGRSRGGQDDRDLSYRGRESADRQPARASRGAGRGAGPPSGHSAARRQGNGPRSASSGRDLDERRDQSPRRGYRRAPGTVDGYDADQGFDQHGGRSYDDRGGAPAASGPQRRRRPDDGAQGGADAPAPARSRRRSGDSAEWDSSEWDQLSDVDYWAELASSKPMTSGTDSKPSRPAAHRGGTAAAPANDSEPETMAVRNPVRSGVPRRDPVTGLPVRGPQPADAELTAAVGRNDFAAAPVPLDQSQDRQRPVAASNGDGGSKHHRRPPAGRNGDQGAADRNSAGRNGDRNSASRPLPPAAPASDRGQRFLDAPGRDPGRYLDVGPASLPMPAIRDVPAAAPARQRPPRDIPAAPPAAAAPAPPAPAAPPPAQAPPARRQRPVPLDDDPLTSPSFPAIRASDSRSYRNGRPDTPPNGSRAPEPYPATTQQRPGYDSPTAQFSAAQYPTAQYSQVQYPEAQYPEAQYPEAQYPEAQYPQAQYPQTQYPQAQYPGAQYSESQYPTAQYPTAPAPPTAQPAPPTAQPSAPRRSGQHSAPQQPAAHRPASGEPGRRRRPEQPAAEHSAPQYAMDDGRAYRPDPLSSRNPYPVPTANGSAGPAAAQPARSPVTPASGNPYGSYVTPESAPAPAPAPSSAPAAGYNGYPAASGNGHGQAYQPPAAPGGTGQNGNGYWHQSAPASGSLPAPEGSGYPETPAHAGQAHQVGVPETDYRNGYGQHSPAGYPPASYPAAPDTPAGYPPVDPYGNDGYGGYPEYGAAER